ncbi:hypothetical protein BRAS3843_1650022 [Bradyrhizobium sp. STM 3843]|nr:hypothetical protein BRAS3843_1650022 [Bradyrhizobium sp. STM 3843]
MQTLTRGLRAIVWALDVGEHHTNVLREFQAVKYVANGRLNEPFQNELIRQSGLPLFDCSVPGVSPATAVIYR